MLENGPGENHSTEELKRMLTHNKGAAAAVNKAWPKELVTDGLFNEYGLKYGAYPFLYQLDGVNICCKLFSRGTNMGRNVKRESLWIQGS